MTVSIEKHNFTVLFTYYGATEKIQWTMWCDYKRISLSKPVTHHRCHTKPRYSTKVKKVSNALPHKNYKKQFAQRIKRTLLLRLPLRVSVYRPLRTDVSPLPVGMHLYTPTNCGFALMPTDRQNCRVPLVCTDPYTAKTAPGTPAAPPHPLASQRALTTTRRRQDAASTRRGRRRIPRRGASCRGLTVKTRAQHRTLFGRRDRTGSSYELSGGCFGETRGRLERRPARFGLGETRTGTRPVSVWTGSRL